MADTKKEHYVPRCYLKNFILENDKIKIFDKFKMQVRVQLKLPQTLRYRKTRKILTIYKLKNKHEEMAEIIFSCIVLNCRL